MTMKQLFLIYGKGPEHFSCSYEKMKELHQRSGNINGICFSGIEKVVCPQRLEGVGSVFHGQRVLAVLQN